MRARKPPLNHDRPESSLSPDRRVPARPTKRRGFDPKTLTTLPPGDHNDGAGLVLRVFPTGARAWMLRYRPKVATKRGPQRRLRLGELGRPLALDVLALRLGEGFRAPGELTLSAAREVGKAPAPIHCWGSMPIRLDAGKELEAPAVSRQRESRSDSANRTHYQEH